MGAQPFGQANSLLARIEEGMAVFDLNAHKVGTVKQVYLGGEDLSEAVVAGDSVLADVPPELRGRLAASGFIEIGTGLLVANRYATGEQVVAVDAEGVRLNVAQDALAKK